jgi:sugar phosphate isomerase/epimerase
MAVKAVVKTRRDLSGGLEWLSLNWATVREQWDLRQVIEGCARHRIPGFAPWREPVQALGVTEAARLIQGHGLAVSGLCRAGMFPAAAAAGRQAAIDEVRRAIDDAAAIEAQCLVIVAGGMPAGTKDLALARRQARDCLAAVLPHARAAGVPLALEPLHPMRVVPGTHRREVVPHADTFAERNMLSRGQEIAVEVDEAHAVDLVLEPGQMSLHHVKIFHGSHQNRAEHRRIGFAIRYLPPHIHQEIGADAATLVRGEDRFGHFELEPAPAFDLAPDAVACHQRVRKARMAILMRDAAEASKAAHPAQAM